jgi:lysophospholipase L1-like esterase
VHRYVALGDSFTEGLDDLRPDGTYRGWADLLAMHLVQRTPDLAYANLAVRGRRIAHVGDDQLPEALRMRPDLVSLAIGGNDITGPSCDVPALGAQFREIVARLADSGARLVVFAGFDTRPMIPLSRTVSARASEYNEHIRATAREFGATLVDLWPLPRLYEPQMWGADRLHLSSAGHRLVARAVVEALGDDAGAIPEPPPSDAPDPARVRRLADDAGWAVEHLLPWFVRAARGRSSGDGIEPKRPRLAPVSPVRASDTTRSA